jgi:hypothetical protein
LANALDGKLLAYAGEEGGVALALRETVKDNGLL